MRENDVGHADDVFVEKDAERCRLDRLHQRGEAGDVGEQRSHLAPAADKIETVGVARKPLGEIGREITRQRGMRPFRGRLPPPGLAQHLQVAERLVDRRLQVGEIDRLGQKIEGAAVHRGANVGHIAIGRDDNGRKPFLGLLKLLQQRQAVHARHVDVGHHHVDIAVRLDCGERLDPVPGEQEADRSVADLAAESLQDKRFQIRLVVDDEDARGHAAHPSRASISPLQHRKIDRLGQQRRGAVFKRLALRFHVAIGRDHDDRHVGAGGPGLWQ